MLSDKLILIVEDNAVAALDLSLAVEELGGSVVGPAASIAEALSLVESHQISGAVLDCQLVDCDVTPLAMALIDRSIPLIFHTGTGLPPALAASHPDLPMLLKPLKSSAVLTALIEQMRTHRT